MRRRAVLLLALMGATLVLASGVALAINTIQCKTKTNCYGTKERDRLLGTNGENLMVGRDRGDILKGFGGPFDYLSGQRGNDKVFGGNGFDRILGGPGKDALNGGDANDEYQIVGNGWGNDTITDTTTSDNDPHRGNEVDFYSLTTSLTINLNSDPASPEVKNASGTSTVNWSGNVIDMVYNNMDLAMTRSREMAQPTISRA